MRTTSATLLFLFSSCLGCTSGGSDQSPALTAPGPISSEVPNAGRYQRRLQLVDTSRHCEHESAPSPVFNPQPSYPPDVRSAGISGRVVLAAIVTVTGELRDVQVVQSDHPRLSVITLHVIQRWRYKPALCDGTPVEVRISTESTFRLY